MRSALLAATGLATMCLLVSTAAQAQPVSGIYVGAGGGLGFLQSEQLRGRVVPGVAGVILPNPKNTTATFRTGYVGLGSIGYGFGNGVRLEIEGSDRYNELNSHNLVPGIRGRSGIERKYGAMGNVLFDLDIGSPYVFPYLGAGAGYQSVDDRQSQTLTNGTFERSKGTNGAFAYQAMFGVSLPVPPVVGLSATLEYRFLGLAGRRSEAFSIRSGGVTTPSGTRRLSGDDTHQILVGLRYAFNVVPPVAPVAAPVPVAASPAVVARSYLVFFDWDHSDLTDRARQIIAEAAAASVKLGSTKIEVAGHADRTGTAEYNQALSRRRAAVVSGELVRLGVPAAAISVSSYGDTRPLVPTAAGVREPQNRRVEIVMK